MDRFISDSLKCLFRQNEKFGLQIQRRIQDLLGYEFNPLCYPTLFDQIEIQMDKFFDVNGQLIYFEQNTQHIDHVTVIITAVFEIKAKTCRRKFIEKTDSSKFFFESLRCTK